MKIVGIDDQKMTYPDFQDASDTDVCVGFDTTEYVLWVGDVVTEPGTVYCAASI
jgi:hypothetical protein